MIAYSTKPTANTKRGAENHNGARCEGIEGGKYLVGSMEIQINRQRYIPFRKKKIKKNVEMGEKRLKEKMAEAKQKKARVRGCRLGLGEGHGPGQPLRQGETVGKEREGAGLTVRAIQV